MSWRRRFRRIIGEGHAHAFRPAGCSRRVEHGSAATSPLRPRGSEAVERAGETGHALSFVVEQHARAARHMPHDAFGSALGVFGRDQEPRIAVLDDVRCFLRSQLGPDAYIVQTNVFCRPAKSQVLGPILEENRYGVTGCEPQRSEEMRATVTAIDKLAVVPALAAVRHQNGGALRAQLRM